MQNPLSRSLENRKPFLPPIFLLVLTALYFQDAILMKGVFAYGDHALYYYPLKAFFARHLKELSFPFWCPQIFSGFPLYAGGDPGVFYPLDIFLFYFLPEDAAYNYSIVLHFYLAGLFMYAFLRALNLEVSSSLLGAVAFMFNGFFMGHLHHMNIIHSMAWMPLLFYLFEKDIQKGALGHSFLGGLVLGNLLLAGDPQFSLFCIMFSFLYLLLRSVLGQKEKFFHPRFLFMFLITAAIGVGIGSVQYLPMFELAQNSSRGVPLDHTTLTMSSFYPKNFITFFMPLLFGNPLEENYWGSFISSDFQELCSYMGLLPLVLAGVAVVKGRTWPSILFLAVLFLSIPLMLGGYAVFYKFVTYIPFLNAMRVPARFLFFAVFSLSVLSAVGLSILLNFEKHCQGKYFRTIFYFSPLGAGASVVFILFYLNKDGSFVHLLPSVNSFLLLLMGCMILLFSYRNGLCARGLFLFLAFLFTVTDLFCFGRGINPTIPRGQFREAPSAAAFFSQDGDRYRIANLFRIAKLPFTKEDFTRSRNMLEPNMGLRYNIADINGYMPLQSARYKKFMGAGGEIGNRLNYDIGYVPPGFEENKLQEQSADLLMGFLSSLNVKYILTPPNLRLEGEGISLVMDQDVRIYKNGQYLPRAFIVHDHEIVKDEKELLKKIRRKDYNALDRIYLEKDIGSTAGHAPPPKEPPPTGGKVLAMQYRVNLISMDIESGGNGFLFLSEAYDPNWKVYVNGRRQEVFRANYMLMAVPVDHRTSKVIFIYEPVLFKAGFVLTGMSIFAGVFGYWELRRRKSFTPDSGDIAYSSKSKLSLILLFMGIMMASWVFYAPQWMNSFREVDKNQSPLAAEEFRKIAEDAYRAGDFDKGITLYEKILRWYPGVKEYYSGLAKGFAGKKDYGKAVELLRKSVDLAPNNSSLFYQLGVYYAENRQEALAKEAFSLALDINPGFTSIYKRMDDYGMTFPKTGTKIIGETGSLDAMVKE